MKGNVSFRKRLTDGLKLVAGVTFLIAIAYYLFLSPQFGILPKTKFTNLFPQLQQRPYIDTLRVFELVNDYRASHGLTMLLFNQSLCDFAKKRLQQVHTDFSHNGYYAAVQKTYCKTCIYAGENLAKGQPDEESIVQDWINSPGHLENIMSPEYTETCISVDKYQGQWFAVQEFVSNY